LEQLIAYSLGALRRDGIDGVADHLEVCGACLGTLCALDNCKDSLICALTGLSKSYACRPVDEDRLIGQLADIGRGHDEVQAHTGSKQGPHRKESPI
jgi:hypothetical protein